MPLSAKKEVAYECENGHVNTEHTSKPHSAGKGFLPACSDCGERLVRKLVPLYACDDCENVWAYTGDADRPTCPNCKGKRTDPVGGGK